MKPSIHMLTVGKFNSHMGILKSLLDHGVVNQIHQVCTGEEAINLYPGLSPDLILMDVTLGGMTGLETTRWIKEQNQEIKIIMAFTKMNNQFLKVLSQIGLDAWLLKDSSVQVYADVIERVIKYC